jgi:outer membrane protein TolC
MGLTRLTRWRSLAPVLVMPVSACVCMSVWLACLDSVSAQAGTPTTFTFDDARARQLQSSDALSAARARVNADRGRAAATRHLHWPDVSLDVLGIGYQKSIDVTVPPLAPTLGLPGSLQFDLREWRIRPLVTATAPIYTGGRIEAAREAAAATVRQAEAEERLTSQSLLVRLVQAYFGQQLAAWTLSVRKDARDGLAQHVENTSALERQGFVTTAQRLQATVARDEAERDYRQAINDLDTATAALSDLLSVDARVDPATPLFVVSKPLPPAEEFQREARLQHPEIDRVKAIVTQARQAVRAQEAELKPTAYVFAQYDLDRSHELIIDADWAWGVGVRYLLFTGNGRRDKLTAVRSQQMEAEARLRQIERELDLAVTRAYNDLRTAQEQFALRDSSIAQAEENMRLQDLSFREGLATSLDVIEARLGLARARVGRAFAAYQFDLALARLLDVSGQTDRYSDYIPRADKVLVP